ncbi:MAG: hypothetical protein E6R12_03900 [Sphingomonadales bacterium]|nr:MAG: hypothetical protein E6R12_03900 [Sphingomonadales bacterium]
MRKALLLLAASAFALSACGEKKHDDGHTDADHAAIAAKEATGGEHAGMDMGEASHHHGAATLKVAMAPAGAFTPGKPQSVTLTLTDVKTGAPIGPDQLALAHTKKLHLLIIDESLTDYQHIHPIAGAKRGDWTFSFTPKFGRKYRVWADSTRKDGDQEYVFADMIAGSEKAPAPDAKPVVTAEMGGLKFALSFAGPVKAGEGVMGSVAIVDAKSGQPFTQLQPIMGAFGHVVAFSRDWSSIEHVHPQGTEPKSDSERSGPVVGFHMEPKNGGIMKIFVQNMANGREVIVPFTVNVSA